jgi:L-amino acid N-acyltransferase YncA
MSVFDVRPAVLHDAATIAQIHVDAWKYAYKGLVAEADLQTLSIQKRLAMWREAIEYAEPQVWVACDALQEVVGFVAFDRSRDPKTKATVGEVWALYLKPDCIGLGVGSTLWGAARDACEDEGFTDITAWVFARNELGLRFYDAMGCKREMKTLRTTPVGSQRLEELRVRFKL